ncbi:MAG: LuxR C-terminal-related transcriptional regulator [Dysgonomonas sp.]
MNFVKSSTQLSALISEHNSLVPVINRFGIKLGLGDKSIIDICDEDQINEDFFLTILNTYLNEDFFPEKKLQSFEVSLVIDYLQKTDTFYVNGSLPNIEKHLHAFIAMSDPNNTQLKLIRNLFYEFKDAFLQRTEKGLLEEDTSFALLLDIKNILIKHISGNFNENLCYAVLFSVDSFLEDLSKHNRIREKILKPMIEELAETGIENWQEMLIVDKAAVQNGDKHISQRELDVLKLIALGLLNKEIADKLNISLNTVLSHRKNITSKLGIKTVSGLTFYCLSHGYISPDSIEL